MQTSRLYCCHAVVHVGQIFARISAKLKCNQGDRCQTRIRTKCRTARDRTMSIGSRITSACTKVQVHYALCEKVPVDTHISTSANTKEIETERRTQRERERRERRKKNTASRDRNLHLFVGLQVVPGESRLT